MKKLIVKILLIFQVDIILDKFKRLMECVRFCRMEQKVGQRIDYVIQGYNPPIVTCARGNGVFSLGKGSHLKGDLRFSVQTITMRVLNQYHMVVKMC